MTSVPSFYEAFDALAVGSQGDSSTSTSIQPQLIRAMKQLYRSWERILSADCLWKLLSCCGCIPPQQQQQQGGGTTESTALLHQWLDSTLGFDFPFNVQTLVSAGIKVCSVMCFGPSVEVVRAELGSTLFSSTTGRSQENIKEVLQASFHVCLVSMATSLRGAAAAAEVSEGGGGISSTSSSSHLKLLIPPLFHCLNFGHMDGNSVEVLHPVRKQQSNHHISSSSAAAAAGVPASRPKVDYHLLDLFPATIVGVSLPTTHNQGTGTTGGRANSSSVGRTPAGAGPPVTRKSVEDTRTVDQLGSLATPNALSLRLRYLDDIESLAWGSAASSSSSDGAPWFPGHAELASSCNFIRTTCVAPQHLTSFTNQAATPQKVVGRKQSSTAAPSAASGGAPNAASPHRNFYCEVMYAKFLLVMAQRLFPRQKGSASSSSASGKVQTSVELAQAFALLSQQTCMFLPQQDFLKHPLSKMSHEASAIVALCLVEHHRQSMCSYVLSKSTGVASTSTVRHFDVDAVMCQLLGYSLCLITPSHQSLPILYEVLLSFLRLDPKAVADAVSSSSAPGASSKGKGGGGGASNSNHAKGSGSAPPHQVRSARNSGNLRSSDTHQQLEWQRKMNALVLSKALLEDPSIPRRLHGTAWPMFEQFSAVLALGWAHGSFTAGGTGKGKLGSTGAGLGGEASTIKLSLKQGPLAGTKRTASASEGKDTEGGDKKKPRLESNVAAAASTTKDEGVGEGEEDEVPPASSPIQQNGATVMNLKSKYDDDSDEDPPGDEESDGWYLQDGESGGSSARGHWLWMQFEEAANEYISLD